VISEAFASGPAATFTREQARGAGFGDHEIACAVRAGRWVRVRRDMYALPFGVGSQPTEEQSHVVRVQGVAAKLGHRCIVSHQSAVLVHGLPVWGASLDQVHLTRIGAGTSRSRAGVTMHLNRLLDGDDVVVHDIRVTTAARSLVDLARVAGFEAGVCAMEAALRLRSTTRIELERASTPLHRQRGAGVARRAVDFVDGASESVGESRMRVAIHELGLPAPQLQELFCNDRGRPVGRVDFWWPDVNVIGEFDGLVKYRGTLGNPVDVLIAEKRREDALRALTGARVIRFTWADLGDRVRLQGVLRSALR